MHQPSSPLPYQHQAILAWNCGVDAVLKQGYESFASRDIPVYTDKTLIGEVERGFNFLGAQFYLSELTLRRPSLSRLHDLLQKKTFTVTLPMQWNPLSSAFC